MKSHNSLKAGKKGEKKKTVKSSYKGLLLFKALRASNVIQRKDYMSGTWVMVSACH